MKLYEKSIQDYSTEILLFTQDNINTSESYQDRGIIYFKLKKYKEAIEDFSKAIEQNPRNTMAYNLRARVYKKIDQPEKAINDFSQINKIETLNKFYPGCYETTTGMSICYYEEFLNQILAE